MSSILKMILSAVVLIVLAWAFCAVIDEAEGAPAFLCIVGWAAAVIAWVVINFGNVLERNR